MALLWIVIQCKALDHAQFFEIKFINLFLKKLKFCGTRYNALICKY